MGPRRRRSRRAGGAGRGLLRPPERRPARRRHHRHQRQDHDQLSDRRRSSTRRGVRCGRIGTVSYDVGGVERDAPRTTPEATDFQRMLREMATNGCGACAAEVSSHALVLKRVDHVRFAAGVFTNLTRDHLDFHRDMAVVLRGQAPAVRPAAGRRDRRRSTSTIPTAASWPASLKPPHHLRHRRARRRQRRARSICRSTASASRSRRSRGAIPVRSPLPGRPNVSTSSPPPRVAIGARPAAPRHPAGHRPRHARARPVRARLGDRDDVCVRRRLRAHRRRAEEPARDGAADGQGPADHGVRLRRRARSHRSGR